MTRRWLLVFVLFFAVFGFSQKASAYVTLEYSYDGTTEQHFNPGTGSISSATTYNQLYSAINSAGTAFTSGSPWGIQPIWYAALGNVSGQYLNVNADYWFAFSSANGSSYITSARNIMTEANLRCAVGDGLSQYDPTYSPTISGYTVTWQGPYSAGSTSSILWRVHVQYKYSQQLSTVKTGGNVRCGWNRSPSNGLFYQWINTSSAVPGMIAYENTGTTATLSSSKTDSLLETQVSQNETIINNTTEINESINDSNINTSGMDPTNITVPSFGPVATIVNSLINLPNTILNVGSCTPINPPLPAYIGGTITIPCPSTLMSPRRRFAGRAIF